VNKSDCTWNTCNGDWGVVGDPSDNPKKDVDKTGTYGPENIWLAKPENGAYTVMVEHWGNGSPQSDGAVFINVPGGVFKVDVTDLAPQRVRTIGTITWADGCATFQPSDDLCDCSSNWASGCDYQLPLETCGGDGETTSTDTGTSTTDTGASTTDTGTSTTDTSTTGPGLGGVGDPCTLPNQCEVLCIVGEGDTSGVCTVPCTGPGDCPAGWSCGALVSPAGNYCLPPDGGGSSGSSSGSSGGETSTETDGGVPSGGACLAAEECVDTAPHCSNVPLSAGLRCSGCEHDAHCVDGGCTFPNPYVAQGAYCSDGGASQGCETGAACKTLTHPWCAPVLSKGALKIRTCSACRTDADCPAGAPNCEPTLDLATHLRGELGCVATGSRANGALCSSPGKLDAACTSGRCATASVWSVFPVGVCGACLTSADCGGLTCMPAVFNPAGASAGSFCQ
jgi:hypothetical protein